MANSTMILSPNFFLALLLTLTTQIFYAKHVISTSNYVHIQSLCSDTEFYDSLEPSYRTDLNSILYNLALNSNKSANNGYYTTNTTVFPGSASDSDIIYGLYLCRGDISTTDCYGCVSTATQNMPPKECRLTDKSAVIWYDKCMVRYSNVSFLGNVDESIDYVFYKNQEDTSSAYQKLAGDTLQGLASQLGASVSSMTGDKKYYATKDATLNNSFVKVYTMAQCTADLSPSDCGRCLHIITNEIPTYCNGSKGCRMLNPSCTVRYEGYVFYEEAKLSPPLAPPAPATSSGNSSDTNAGKQRSSESLGLKIGVGCLVLLLVVLVAVLMFLLCKKERSNNDAGNGIITMRSIRSSQSLNFVNVTSVNSLQYDLAALETATNSFSNDNKIGEGGFGGVYKGTLLNGVEIAVKRLSKDSCQGLEQFKNEVLLVAKHQHRNLVKLQGFCLTSDEMLLVYEFVCNKSLDLMLFGPNTNKRELLDWSARYKIINGVARGLSYLHEDSRLKIVHRDLKASNILLDADMNPKISDFGLARNFSGNQQQEHTVRLAGTLGYMAPEYVESGEISTKSDVYSFGVLALEIISGKKISNRPIGLSENLLAYAWKHWNEDTVSTFVDPTMEDAYSSDEVKRCIQMGLLCVQGETEERPSMIKVLSYLNSNVDVPAPRQPTFVASVKLGSGSGTGEVHSDKSNKSRSRTTTRTTASQSNLSTSRSSQSFPGTDESC